MVFAAGNGKCQEMLSLRIVVLPGGERVGDAGEVDQAIDVGEDGVGRDPEDRDLGLHLNPDGQAASPAATTSESPAYCWTIESRPV